MEAVQEVMPPAQIHGERSLCPLVVRITPMPHFVADWQVAQHLRPFGDVTSVRFQRTGDGTALVRFQTSSGAEMALRAQSVGIFGHRCYVQPCWCEARFHLWQGYCSADDPPRQMNDGMGNITPGMASLQHDAGTEQQQYAPAGMGGGEMHYGLAAGMANAMGGPMGDTSLAAGMANEMRWMDGGSGTILNVAGDWKCERCNNLNYAYRTRCNRCHAAPAHNVLSRQVPPTRCPLTVMVSPSDRAKKGLQATDEAVAVAMCRFGDVVKLSAFAPRQSGAGSCKFVRFRDAGAATAALESSEVMLIDPRGQPEAACIRPAYQRFSGKIGAQSGGMQTSVAAGFGGGGGGGGGFGMMPGGTHDATGGGLGAIMSSHGQPPLGGLRGHGMHQPTFSGGQEATMVSPMIALPHHAHMPPLPGYGVGGAGAPYVGLPGALMPMEGAPIGSGAVMGGGPLQPQMHVFMDTLGLPMPHMPPGTTMQPLHAPPPEATWQMHAAPHVPLHMGTHAYAPEGAEIYNNGQGLLPRHPMAPHMPSGPNEQKQAAAPLHATDGGFSGGLLNGGGSGAPNGFGSQKVPSRRANSRGCGQASGQASGRPGSRAGGHNGGATNTEQTEVVLPPSLGALESITTGATNEDLPHASHGGSPVGSPVVKSPVKPSVGSPAVVNSPENSPVVNPTAAEFGRAAVVPTDEARGEAKVELKSQLKSQFAAGLGAGAVASAQVLTQHALMAMHAWPARVSQGVTEVPAIASVDGSGGSQNRQGGSDMESVCPPPTHPSAHEGQPAGPAANSAATSAVTSTARSITFLLVSEGSRAPPCIRRLANATSLDYVLAELRTAMNLPTAAPLVYLAPEFDEWVAIDDLSALPEKCRVRAMVMGAMAAVELADEAPSAFTAECTAEVPPAGGRSTQTRQTKARQTARLGAARSSEPEQPEAPPLKSIE
jgi:hypothetical protein